MHDPFRFPKVVPLLAALAYAQVAESQDFSDYSGAALYARFCAACHGATGVGDGPVASSLRIMVPDLTRISKRQGDFPPEQIARIIDGRKVVPAHGTREMPVWGLEFHAENRELPASEQRTSRMIARLTEYIRSIQRD